MRNGTQVAEVRVDDNPVLGRTYTVEVDFANLAKGVAEFVETFDVDGEAFSDWADAVNLFLRRIQS